MALHLYLSNSLETLAEEFKKQLCLPLKGSDPFVSVCGVVPNGGMGAFLKRHLARKENLGIAANIEAPFLQKFLMESICCFLNEEECEKFRSSMRFWSPGSLSWQIDAILSKNGAKYGEFTAYCADDPTRRHLLACELAGNFDRYQLYRSSVTGHTELQEWRSKESETLQGKLYYELCALMPDPDSFYTRFFSASAPVRKLPENVGIFGIGAMPALYLYALQKISEHSEIFLFCPSPCQEYWGDLKSAGESLKELKQDPERVSELLEDSAGNNQLLADLGVIGREFFNLLLDSDCFSGSGPQELYKDPAPEEKGTALQIFQSDILNARVRNDENKIIPVPSDDSIRINCCSDARRELEILHDQLLELFYTKGSSSHDKSAVKVTNALRMEDVIVMFPDINQAAPMIDAVFSAGPFKGHYAICDRSSAVQSQVIECFKRLLELPSGRANSLEILELLEFDCLSSKLGISSEAIPELTDLVARVRISWGLDEKEHQKFRMTPFKEFSWEDGIDRLLEEFARGEDASLITGIEDSGGIDGGLAENLAILAGFIDLLKRWRAELHKSRTPEAWKEFMGEWIDNFFAGCAREFQPEVNELRRATGKTVSDAAAALEDVLIDSKVFISRLQSEFSLPGGKQQFLRDKITFCSLVPLRAVPAKVIAVLGLNDGSFPGIDRRNSFDLLAQIRRNDPNLSNDGRYLFLEALLAAREHLILSYVGFDNGEELAPAIPLVTVEEVLKKGFGIEKKRIPLQSLELDALALWRQSEKERPVLQAEGAAVEVPLPEKMHINKLCELLTQNCEGFFKIRCGFDYEKYEKQPPQTDDPETLGPLDTSTVQKGLWSMRVAGIPQDKWRPFVERVRLLPVNGKSTYTELEQTVTDLPEELVEAFKTQTALLCEQTFCGVTLFSTLEFPRSTGDNICRYMVLFSHSSGEKLFQFYLEHLLLTCQMGEKHSVTGKLVFAKEEEKKKLRSFPVISPADARTKLEELMGIALRTYSASLPLPVFAEASLECAKDPSSANIKKKFVEKDLKYNKVIEQFFDEENFCEGEFEDLAAAIFSDIVNIEPEEL